MPVTIEPIEAQVKRETNAVNPAESELRNAEHTALTTLLEHAVYYAKAVEALYSEGADEILKATLHLISARFAGVTE